MQTDNFHVNQCQYLTLYFMFAKQIAISDAKIILCTITNKVKIWLVCNMCYHNNYSAGCHVQDAQFWSYIFIMVVLAIFNWCCTCRLGETTGLGCFAGYFFIENWSLLNFTEHLLELTFYYFGCINCWIQVFMDDIINIKCFWS